MLPLAEILLSNTKTEIKRMKTIKKAIESYTKSLLDIYPNLTPEELCFIVSKVTVTKLETKKYYLNAGEAQPSMGFVYSGLLRSYYIDESGKEITISFIKENTYASDYSAFITKTFKILYSSP